MPYTLVARFEGQDVPVAIIEPLEHARKMAEAFEQLPNATRWLAERVISDSDKTFADMSDRKFYCVAILDLPAEGRLYHLLAGRIEELQKLQDAASDNR